MKRVSILTMSFIVLLTFGWAQAQQLKTIKLNTPNMKRGSSLMEALSKKASTQSWADKDLSMQDISDLLWAAAGVNRPDNKKRVFSTAMNAQDVDVYVFMKDGVYLYDYINHALTPVLSGDHRQDISSSLSMGGGGRGGAPGGPPGEAAGGARGGAPGGAPESGPGGTPGGRPGGGAGGERNSSFAIDILLVGDPTKYRAGTDDLKSEWSALAAGSISQNILLFCAANDLGGRPRAAFDKATIKNLLNLKETQNPILEIPVGYK